MTGRRRTQVIGEAQQQTRYLDEVATSTARPNRGAARARHGRCSPEAGGGLTQRRMVRRQARRLPGYGELIKRYVAFLQTKITFHKEHPEFKGNMSYEDYLALRKASDLQEGYAQHCEAS